MNGTKFTLVIKKEDGRLIRLDTLQEVPKESLHTVKQPPIIFSWESSAELPMYIKDKKGFREKSNALLVGERIIGKDYDYYPLAYCKI
jgi:hypothetical protein